MAGKGKAEDPVMAEFAAAEAELERGIAQSQTAYRMEVLADCQAAVAVMWERIAPVRERERAELASLRAERDELLIVVSRAHDSDADFARPCGCEWCKRAALAAAGRGLEGGGDA